MLKKTNLCNLIVYVHHLLRETLQLSCFHKLLLNVCVVYFKNCNNKSPNAKQVSLCLIIVNSQCEM